MKCSKCGAECDPRQLFCLRCGTPLNGDRKEENEDIIKEVEVPIEDIVNPINLEDDDDDDDDIDLLIGRDISRVKPRTNAQSASPKEERKAGNMPKAAVRTEVPKNQNNRPKSNQDNRTQLNQKEDKNQKNDADKRKKKMIIGASIGVAAVVLVIILVLVFKMNSGKFDEYYNNGMNLYNKGKVQSSITQFRKAADVAKKNDDKVEANVMLWKAYSQLDGYENEQIEVLKELIELKPKDETYYKALITVYQSLDDQDSIDELIDSVKDSRLKDKLKEFDGTTPVATIAPGEYDKPISLGLTAAAGCTIYYTTDGSDATKKSLVYTKSIELKEEGEHTVKAISLDNKGNLSRQFVGKYVLDFGTVNPPVVKLDSGTYTEKKKIEVTADLGCKIYYTTNETIPTKDSKEYTKPIKLPSKNTVYYFVAIDADGVSSDVVTRVYKYEKVYAYTYDSAVSGLSNVLISKGIMENKFGSYEDGSSMYFEYESIEKIDGAYYYIIKATKEAEDGKTVSTETYAYGCDNALSYKAAFSGGSYTLTEIE